MASEAVLKDLLEAAIVAGIATAKPTRANLKKLQEKVVWLKEGIHGCSFATDAEFRRRMPIYARMQSGTLKYAEEGRIALREVLVNCIAAGRKK